MAQFAKLQSLQPRASRTQAPAVLDISCGFLDAHTQRPDTSQQPLRFALSLTDLVSLAYRLARIHFSRQLECTPQVSVCETERNEGCSHVSQKTHPQFPPTFLSKTLFCTRTRGNRALRARANFVGGRSALAAAHARLGATSPSHTEGPGPARCASVRERNRLRRNCFVRRSTRSLPSLRISPRARSGRCFENLSDGRPRRQTRELQNFSFGRKRSAHRRPAPQPNGVSWTDHSLRTRCVDSAGFCFRSAAKPHVRDRLQSSHRSKTGNASFLSASSRTCGFSCFQIADRLARSRPEHASASAVDASSGAAAGLGHSRRRAFLQSAARLFSRRRRDGKQLHGCKRRSHACGLEKARRPRRHRPPAGSQTRSGERLLDWHVANLARNAARRSPTLSERQASLRRVAAASATFA